MVSTLSGPGKAGWRWYFQPSPSFAFQPSLSPKWICEYVNMAKPKEWTPWQEGTMLEVISAHLSKPFPIPGDPFQLLPICLPAPRWQHYPKDDCRTERDHIHVPSSAFPLGKRGQCLCTFVLEGTIFSCAAAMQGIEMQPRILTKAGYGRGIENPHEGEQMNLLLGKNKQTIANLWWLINACRSLWRSQHYSWWM